MRAALLSLAALALHCGGCSETTAPATFGPTFPKLTGRVVDGADLLPQDREVALSQELARLEREVGPQVVVVTVADLQGYPIETYSNGLGRHWGIGSKERNDGLLLVVARDDRKVRIEVGYGLEKRVSDHFAAKVIREQLLPRFREGRYPEGIEQGTAAVVERLRSGREDTYAWEKKAA